MPTNKELPVSAAQRRRLDPEAQRKADLNCLHAVQNVLKDLPSNKAKGHMLIEFIHDYPYLEKYFRSMYGDEPIEIKVKGLSKEQKAVVDSMNNDRDFGCGLTELVIAKVFKRLGIDPLRSDYYKDAPFREEGLMIELRDADEESRSMFGDISYNGFSIGTIEFKLGKPCTDGIKAFKAKGIKVK